MKKKKLIRVTTADISLNGLLKGQLAFLNQYYEVVGIASDTGELNIVRDREGIRTISIPMHREISIKNDIKSLIALYRVFKAERPYIVHANTPKGSLLSMMAAKMAHVPHRIYLVTGLRYQGATGILRMILKTMERITCFCATKIIPEGNGVKKYLIEDRITCKPADIIHNGNINGIDTEYFSPSLHSNSSLNEEKNGRVFTFIFIGRIVKDKGINELTEVIRRLKHDGYQFKLVLVGNFESKLDPLENDNEEFLKKDTCVEYAGYQNDVRPYFEKADALVFPSYREGFPNVVLQAGSMGLASIVTNISGCNEIIKDGLNGRIIQPRNAEALYQTMKYFLEHPAEVKRMSKNARSIIQEKFEQKDLWRELLKMYRSLDNEHES